MVNSKKKSIEDVHQIGDIIFVKKEKIYGNLNNTPELMEELYVLDPLQETY